MQTETNQRLTVAELIAAVRAHALANYTVGGWDVVVEAWDDEEIEELVANSDSSDEAIVSVGAVIRASHDYAEDVRGAGGLFDEFPVGEFAPQANVGAGR